MNATTMKEAVITIQGERPRTASVQLVMGDGRTNRYNVQTQDLAGMLDKGMVREKRVIYERIGSVPIGYLDMAYADRDNFKIACRIPGSVRCYHYMVAEQSRLFLVPFPMMLFLIDVSKGGVTSQSQCWAVNDADEICLFPFPNVSSKGSICWGGNRIEKLNGIGEVEKVIELFLTSGFNTHLYEPEKTTLGLSIENLLRYLEPLESFPSEILQGTKKTVCSQVSKFLSAQD